MTIYTVDCLRITSYFKTLEGAKNYLTVKGYKEVYPEDFDYNTKAEWKCEATTFFRESIAYIGFIHVFDE